MCIKGSPWEGGEMGEWLRMVLKQAMGQILKQVQEDAKLKEGTKPNSNYR
ncbi:hypothetical protein ACRTDU_20460 [Sunxiuqinia elliptica]